MEHREESAASAHGVRSAAPAGGEAFADLIRGQGFADLGDVRLHYVEAGEGPLVVLLHGFPEFWYSWRSQIPALTAAGFRVVAPDMRGYNLSSRPGGASSYTNEKLAGDVAALIEERGERSALLAGHDWGAAVAWVTAMNHPESIERLAILNLPHPRRLLHAFRDPRQLMRSWYMFFFQLPWLPERALRARNWAGLRRGLERDSHPGAFSSADLERYAQAWSTPGALTAMLNYYRAALRQTPWAAERQMQPVTAPTMVIFGERDHYLRHQLAEPYPRDVPNLERVVRLPGISHFVQNDAPEEVNRLLIEFFAPSQD
jgi:pimeloyl-ACP methyl ester carboxylesterase